MNKRIKTAVGSVALVSASLLGGGLFAASAVNAQVDDAPVVTVLDDDGVDAPVDTDGVDTPADADGADAPEDGERGRRGRHGNRGDRGARGEATAELLGIEVDELRTAIQAGDTLADIAEANGVDPQTIIDAKVDSKTERIQAKVDAGDITQVEADEKLADLEERVTTRVNEGRPERGERQAPADDAGTDAEG